MVGSAIEFVLTVAGGWLCGMALNYLEDVLPRTRKLSLPICQHCASSIPAWDYLAVKPCRSCGQTRLARTWIVQGFSLVLVPLMFYFPPQRFGFWISLPYFFYFALVFIMDMEHRVILNEISVAGVALAIPLGIYWNGLVMTAIGGAVGFGIMIVLYYFGILFNRVMAKRRGEPMDEVALGFGDVNISGILGLILGWPKIAISLFFSVVLGGVISGLYLLFSVLTRSYRPFTAIPYAPFLVIVAVVLFYLA
ncbi:MAG: A24 family peptidase [Bellilinea sp.]|jgi:leader peptidase (prepilin peptidase)/N-methyltransferase